MLVAEFSLPSPEERETRRLEIEAEIREAARGLEDASVEQKTEPVEQDEVDDGDVDLPSAPDLDILTAEE